jgi:hypothetical protein
VSGSPPPTATRSGTRATARARSCGGSHTSQQLDIHTSGARPASLATDAPRIHPSRGTTPWPARRRLSRHPRNSRPPAKSSHRNRRELVRLQLDHPR